MPSPSDPQTPSTATTTGLPTYVDGYRNAPVAVPAVPTEAPAAAQPDAGQVMSVDTGALRRTAGLVQQAGDAAQAAVAASPAETGSEPWGDDTGLGKAFGTLFAGPERALHDALGELPAVFEDLAEQLLAGARRYEDAEQAATGLARTLRQEMADKA